MLIKEIDKVFTFFPLILNYLELKELYISQAKLTQMIYDLSKHAE